MDGLSPVEAHKADGHGAADCEEKGEGGGHGDASADRPHKLTFLAHSVELEHGDDLAVDVVAADLSLLHHDRRCAGLVVRYAGERRGDALGLVLVARVVKAAVLAD